jgi:hypothetical protein
MKKRSFRMRIKEYINILDQLLKKYIYGITVQSNKLYISTDIENAEKLIKILKNSIILKGETLIDIFSIDTNQTKRFSITYTI